MHVAAIFCGASVARASRFDECERRVSVPNRLRGTASGSRKAFLGRERAAKWGRNPLAGGGWARSPLRGPPAVRRIYWVRWAMAAEARARSGL